MKPTVYVDTPIPSYYIDERDSLRLLIDRTRQWWDAERLQYEVYISDLVRLELEEGDYPRKPEALTLVAELPRLAEIGGIVETYLALTPLELVPIEPEEMP